MSYPPAGPSPWEQSGPEPGDQPGALTSEDRTWALTAHIGSLVAAWFAFGFLAPLVVLLVQGGKSPFVRRHAVESLNFQLSLLIYIVVGGIAAFLLTLVTLGLALVVIIPLAIAIAIGALVVVILATVRASNGEDYRYPLTIRIVS
ncbi:DUF4870 domain-containing protein [Nocardioides donggukensis]|uniref:DUF4870 domain-containing protein n=1 Tax=Nocardioides donggukensis TaxID=2774019 RepID=UPI00191D149D|nr:DUF4870 domain-containing protein [Nocardioides donggukensis]